MNETTHKFVTKVAHEPDLGTDPIPAHYYYDPKWFDLECEAIFRTSWLQVGHVCELPEIGSFIVRELEFADASILITKGKKLNPCLS